MFCPKCGNKLDENASFCTSCGESTKRKTNAPDEKQAATNQAHPIPSAKKKLPMVAIAGTAIAAAALGIGAAAFFFSSTPIDVEHFPDQAFRTYVSQTADTDKDGKLSRKEANAIECIGRWDETSSTYDEPLSNAGITNLEGIGCFRNLKGLVVNDNPITSLDLSKNKKLEYAITDSQSLTHVDASGCGNLENLWVTADAQVAGLSNKMEVAHLIDECAMPYTESTDREASYTYAPDGRLIQASETLDYSTTTYAYEYNTEGKPAKKQILSDGEIQTTEVFDYDNQGRLVSEKYVSDLGTGFVQNLSYDNKGRVSQLEIINSAVSDTVNTYQYHYDNKDRLTSVDVCEKYDGEVEGQGSYTLTYDENGNLTCVSAQTDLGQGKNYSDTFLYDNDGNLVGETFAFGGSSEDEVLYEYNYSLPDENGTVRATETTYNEASLPELTFDEKGRIIKEERFYEGDLTYSYEYTYTSEGMLKTCSEEPRDLRDHYFIPIAHYGKDVKDDTVRFNDFRTTPFTPIRAYYTPDIIRYEYGYADTVAGATMPEPANYPFSLIAG